MKKITYFLLGCVIFAPVHSQNKTKKMSDKLQPPVAKIVPKTIPLVIVWYEQLIFGNIHFLYSDNQ